MLVPIEAVEVESLVRVIRGSVVYDRDNADCRDIRYVETIRDIV